MPVEIRSTIVPPDRTAFAERFLGFVHGAMCCRFNPRIIIRLCIPDRPPGRHQPSRQPGPLALFEIRIGHAPKAASDDEISPIGGHRMLHADFRCDFAGLFFARASLVTFFPATGTVFPPDQWPPWAPWPFFFGAFRTLLLGFKTNEARRFRHRAAFIFRFTTQEW
jgi:hypothetical protein